MNVTCPNCATVYRVDPAKVPEAGVRARCAVCSAVFGVQRDGRQPGAAPAAAAAPPVAVSAPAGTPPAPVAPAGPPPRPAAPVAPPAAAPASAPGGPPPGPARPTVPPAGPAGAPRAPAAPPAAPSALPPRPVAAPMAGRPVNPFLSQDPALKARRLARALISDIVVYHPAKRQEGLRDGTLKELFEEEIRKSYEEYTEQVGREIAETTGYFREALNEILAGGRQIF